MRRTCNFSTLSFSLCPFSIFFSSPCCFKAISADPPLLPNSRSCSLQTLTPEASFAWLSCGLFVHALFLLVFALLLLKHTLGNKLGKHGVFKRLAFHLILPKLQPLTVHPLRFSAVLKNSNGFGRFDHASAGIDRESCWPSCVCMCVCMCDCVYV